MSYTKFGEFMRIQRIKHHEIMSDSAKLFGVTLPYMSAIENGKKNIPEDWFNIIVNHYQLNNCEQNELKSAFNESKTQVKLNLTGSSNLKRSVAFQFQRSFNNLDEKTAQEILNLLNKKED